MSAKNTEGERPWTRDPEGLLATLYAASHPENASGLSYVVVAGLAGDAEHAIRTLRAQLAEAHEKVGSLQIELESAAEEAIDRHRAFNEEQAARKSDAEGHAAYRDVAEAINAKCKAQLAEAERERGELRALFVRAARRVPMGWLITAKEAALYALTKHAPEGREGSDG